LARNIQALLQAPVGESFTGPALFEPEAAAQLLAQLLGDNLHITRKPVSDPNRPVNVVSSEFEGRTGSRVLPEWMDVVDDATQTVYQGKTLMGYYPFDFEGVRPKAVALIEKGVLKTFLTTRQQGKNLPTSNGHARFPAGFGTRAAGLGNLFVKATQTSPLADLKARLIQMCKDRDKPYGLLIRKLDFPFSGGNSEMQTLQTGSANSGGSVRPVSPPVLIYRVYPDGREELIRGMRFRGLSTRSLRDILAASTETAVFDYINNGAPLARSGLAGYIALTSVISPGLLFDDLDVDRLQDQLQKPPLVPPPDRTANR
jgi:TldD protein